MWVQLCKSGYFRILKQEEPFCEGVLNEGVNNGYNDD